MGEESGFFLIDINQHALLHSVVNMNLTICLNSKFKPVMVLLDELPRNFYVFSRSSFISPNNASRMNVA